MDIIKAHRRDLKFHNNRLVSDQGSTTTEEDDVDDIVVLVSPIEILRFLQLFAEGHNLRMQKALLNQSSLGNTKTYCIVQTVANFLAVIAKDEMHLSELNSEEARLLIGAWEFLIEILQGPCLSNQDHLAESVMVEVFRNVLTAKFSENMDRKDIKMVKSRAVKAMVSLLEGRTDNRIQTRLLQNLELHPLQQRLEEIYEEFHVLKKENIQNGSSWDEEFLEEGFDLLTLAQSIYSENDLKPIENKLPIQGEFRSDAHYRHALITFRAAALYQSAYAFFTKRQCSVEVWWGMQTQHLDTIYFPMPSHCQMLPYAAASKDRFLQSLSFGSENRLAQFVDGSQHLDEELRHIELLNGFWFYNVIRPYIPLFKKASFALALLMNLVMLTSLQHGFDGKSYVYAPENMEISMTVFGCTQLILSVLVVLFMLVVRAPLVYQKRLNAYTSLTMHQYKSSKAGHSLANMSALGSNLVGSLNELTNVTDNAKRLGGNVKSRILTFIHFYKSCFRYVFLLAMLQIMFVYAHPAITPVFLLIFLSLVFLAWPAGTATRRYLENSTTPFAFVFCCIYDVVMDKYTAFYCLYLITAGFGFFRHPSFYAYHLLDLVVMSTALQNVVRAVTRPRHALMMTTILGLFMVYFFTLALFFFIPDDTYDAENARSSCTTMVRCFFTILHRGLLSGGGVGEYLTSELGVAPSFTSSYDFAVRTLFDLSFFVVVLVLLLNIIFGIIIDTFSELRSQSSEKQTKMKNQCFICAVPSQEFENHYMRNGTPNGFSKHIGEQHNMWNYLYFLIYLRSKDKTDCTGAESYVLDHIENDDLSWIPQGMAKCLDVTNQKSVEEQLHGVKTEMHDVKQQVHTIFHPTKR